MNLLTITDPVEEISCLLQSLSPSIQLDINVLLKILSKMIKKS